MHLGMVGLGRMGADMTRRLVKGGHDLVVTDVDGGQVAELAAEGATATESVAELIAKLPTPRLVWLMMPSDDATAGAFREALGHLEQGDVLVDGSDSHFSATVRRAAQAERQGVRMLDAGIAAGATGLVGGYNIMVGGELGAFRLAEPALRALSPGDGYARVGPVGAGHFVKMVHQGVEYALLQAYGEGFEALAAYPHADLDLQRIAELWTHGSAIRSWLLELLATALADDPQLAASPGPVEDDGMARWLVDFGVGSALPLAAISTALFARFRSRLDDGLSAKVVGTLHKRLHEPPAREV